MINVKRAFELENGVVLDENGVALFGVNNSPVGSEAAEGSVAFDSNGFKWVKTGSGNNDWSLLSLNRPILSSKPTYVSDKITVMEFFNSATQVTANRIARIEYTYNGSDFLTQEELKIYDTDGTTLVRTFINSYTYTGDNVTNVTMAES